jgi:hypothetical protein
MLSSYIAQQAHHAWVTYARGNHNPRWMVYEPALAVGMRAMATMAVDFVSGPGVPALKAARAPK